LPEHFEAVSLSELETKSRNLKANLRQLKSNSSKVFPINYKFICLHIFRFCAESQTLRILSLSFVRLSWS